MRQNTRMSITISYASRRGEVLRWYWQMWRQRLWRTHLSVFLATAAAASMLLFRGFPSTSSEIIEVGGIGLVPIAGFALFPMIKFKPERRTLTVDDEGIVTLIGEREGTVAWNEISLIKSDGDSLVIQRSNLNSFIVPARAFETSDARSEFYNFVHSRVPAPSS